MSKSRLEKFLYALYSLDSSDLPTPLSRIEELYKCWVTGEEVPTFEPISRTEKYLMAILGGYDVNSLPNPLSRVEVLLYKLATGDDNLDDIKSFLSEHEELLAEIIRNGGAGGNIDIEYVLYTLSTEFNTLYNTAEKPVKSAILKGQTLVNIHPTDYTVSGSSNTFFLSKSMPKTIFKPNTRYFLRLYNTHQSIVSAYFRPGVENKVDLISSDNKCAIFTTKSVLTDYDFNNSNKIHFYSSGNLTLNDVKDTKVILCEYVDGMENWDIPYFEGMQSVKMPVLKTSGNNTFNIKNTGTNRVGWYSIPLESSFSGEIYIKVAESLPSDFRINILTNNNMEHPLSNNEIKNGYNASFEKITNIDFNCPSLSIEEYSRGNLDDLIANGNIVIKLGGEPYKSNILTVNEDVSLRSNGSVYDELDLLTGKLTQRIDEDGSLLTQEVVKTVDLSVVNQDGNSTKLNTFNDITYVTLSSEGLIPEAELEVATKNEEVLNTMSLEMDDISTTQNDLQETSNTQSENVDATMVATTEIYEGLL